MDGKDAGRLRGFISSLVRTDRLLLLLHYCDGLSVAEISCVLDLPKLSVAQRLVQLQAEARRCLASGLSCGDVAGAT